MKNDIGDAKQEVDSSCSLENVQYWADITIMYGIDKDGEPLEEVDHTETSDFRCYVCMDCDNDFESFEKVKEHLDA